MKRLIRWTAVVLALLISAAATLATAANVLAERKRDRIVQVKVARVAEVGDAAASCTANASLLRRRQGPCFFASTGRGTWSR